MIKLKIMSSTAAQFSEGYINSPDTQIHYYRTGGSKPPIVLIHGATDDGLCWMPLIEALIPNWDVVAMDLRGHGLSGSGHGDYSPNVRLDDLLALLAALKLENPVLCGHSLGAESALSAALALPERIRALILEDPALILPGENLFGGVTGWLVAKSPKGYQQILRLIKKLTSKPGHCRNTEEVTSTFSAWLASKRKLSRDYIDAVATLGPEDFQPFSLLEHIDVQTLLFVGDRRKGSIIPMKKAVETAPKKVQIHHFSGASHNIRHHDQNRYIQDIIEFLDQLPPV